MLNIVGHRKIWFTLSGVLVGAALIAMAIFGFKQSAEFKGGTLWEFSLPAANASLSDVQQFFSSNLHIANADISFETRIGEFVLKSFESPHPFCAGVYVPVGVDIPPPPPPNFSGFFVAIKSPTAFLYSVSLLFNHSVNPSIADGTSDCFNISHMIFIVK